MPSSTCQLVDKNWQTLGVTILPPAEEARLITLRCAPALHRDEAFAIAGGPVEPIADLRLLMGNSNAALCFRNVSNARMLVESLPLPAGDALYVASTVPGSHVVWATW